MHRDEKVAMFVSGNVFLFRGSFQELCTPCTYSFTLMLVKSNDISEMSTFHFHVEENYF